MTQILAQPTVRNPLTKDLIPSALADLGVQRDVEYPVAPLETAHRVSGDTDYYFIANSHATAAASVDATFAMTDPTAVPYFADAWSGKLVAGRELHRVRRAREDPHLPQGRPDDDPRPRPRPERAAAARDLDHRRRGPRGRHEPRRPRDDARHLHDDALGRSLVDTTSRSVAGRCSPLTHWNLSVDDFLPGATATQTLHATHTLTLDGLKAWPDIPELADVSGIGTYTTTVNWQGGGGAYLDLGEVFDTYRVSASTARRSRPPTSSTRPSTSGRT